MKLYNISYYLYYQLGESLKSGSYMMYVENIKDIFDTAYEKIKENEIEYEEREFSEERLTGFELQFQLAKNQDWDGSPPRKITYSLKSQKIKGKRL